MYKPTIEELPSYILEKIKLNCESDSKYYQREYDGPHVSKEILIRYYQDLSAEKVEELVFKSYQQIFKVFKQLEALKYQYISDRLVQDPFY